MKFKQKIKQAKVCGLIVVVIVIFGHFQANAQKTSLRVGDPAPPITAFKWIKGKPVDELKKGQVYVIEFGATWCKPCVATIPKLTGLTKKYGNRVSVISFFVMEANNEPIDTKDPKYVRKVEKYVSEKANRIKYTVAVDDPQNTMNKTWRLAAGSTGIPVTFVIDRDGRIAWIGNDMQKVDALVKAINDGSYSLKEMIRKAREEEAKKTPYDAGRPLLIDGNGGRETDYMFRSILAKYKGDIKTGRSEFIAGNQKMVQEIGASLPFLYRLAHGDTIFPYPMTLINSHGKYWLNPVLEVKDSMPFQFDYKSARNRWNYSLTLPEKASAGTLQKAMQRDLKTYFGYEAKVETRKMPCWILTATKKAEKNLPTKTPGKAYNAKGDKSTGFLLTNTNMKNIIYSLWSNNQLGPPFIDETGIEGEIDIEIKVNMEVLEDMIKGLNEIGLILKKGEREMKVVVIRDATGQ